MMPMIVGAPVGRGLITDISGRAVALALCAAIAVLAQVAAGYAPAVGAPVFAIAIGILLANTWPRHRSLHALPVSALSKISLKIGIVVLGGSLDLGQIVGVGLESLPILLLTISVGLACALCTGWLLQVDWRIRCLIGIGTTICGASAIAALAPVVRAKAEEIAYAISVVFLFNMIAVIVFPAFGHLMTLNQHGFGLWAGTAVNDTSAVVAAGFAYGKAAGIYATVVKLTRTTFIVPLVLGFGLLMPLIDRNTGVATRGTLGSRVRNAVPLFIVLFVLASVLNTFGLIGIDPSEVQIAGRWILVVALAAVGLQGRWKAFTGAGFRPLLLGLLTWVAVALASLAAQAWSGTL